VRYLAVRASPWMELDYGCVLATISRDLLGRLRVIDSVVPFDCLH